MFYNVQPLRTKSDSDDVLFVLRRTNYSKRNVFLFLFGITVGLRASDIVYRKVKDITYSLTPKIIKKMGKTQTLHLENLQPVIKTCIEEMNLTEEDYLFPSHAGNSHLTVNGLYRIFQNVGIQLEQSDLANHTIRKNFGYNYYMKTKDLGTSVIIFNHSSEKITKRYLGITDQEIGESLADFKLGF
nr:tyrosine-type recombinase/integrase [Carnobacterium maltaromaticum]